MSMAKKQPGKARILGLKGGLLQFALILLITATVVGSLAYIVIVREPLVNKFTAAPVSCQVEEAFNGTVKSNVTVRNTSNTSVYIRVRFVTYRVNDDGQHIGGTAEIPSFTPGTDWVKMGDFYYFTKPVSAGATPAAYLIGANGITLSTYSDADGGKQVIEVMAEAIQARGLDEDAQPPVVISWENVESISADGTLVLKGAG